MHQNTENRQNTDVLINLFFLNVHQVSGLVQRNFLIIPLQKTANDGITTFLLLLLF